MTKESILKRKKAAIIMSENLFLSFEGDTLWVYFFKSEANAHILSSFVSNASPSSHYSSVLSLMNNSSISERACKHCVFNEVENWDPQCDFCLFRQFK